MPLTNLLEVDDVTALGEDEAALFYSQSWLLVHYLRSLPDADQSIGPALQRYARLASDGSMPTDAFEQAFAVKIHPFEQALLQYYLDRRFTSRQVAVNTALPGFTPRVSNMSKAEAMLALAQMALRFENTDAAEAWFSAVLDDNELRPHAEAGLGRVQGRRGNIDAANEHKNEIRVTPDRIAGERIDYLRSNARIEFIDGLRVSRQRQRRT